MRGSTFFSSEVVLPSGVVELMVSFGPMQKVLAYGDRRVDEDFRTAWVAGAQDQPLTVGSPTGANHIAVRFRPGGAHPFFRSPMSELRNQVVDLDLVPGGGAGALRERLEAAPTDAARVRLMEGWLRERRRDDHPYHATVRRAMDRVRASAFRTRVGDLCEGLGLSNRHLIAQFRQIVGLTPKTMARVDRFQAVVRAVEGRTEVRWGRMAARFGFADQSHLVRDFRRFAGVTPSEFIARRAPDGAHLIVE